MDFFIGWMSTIVASSMIQIGTLLTMIKDVADGGCLIDTSKVEKVISFSQDNDTGASKIVDYVPIVNVLNSMQLYTNYLQNRENVLSTLDNIGIFKEMNENDLKKYNSKPTVYNALKIYLEQRRRDREAYEHMELQYTLDKIHHTDIIKEYLDYFDDLLVAEEEYRKDREIRLSSDDPDLEGKLKNTKIIDLKKDGKIYYTIDDDKDSYNLSDFRVVYLEGKLNKDEVTFNERKVGYFLSTMDIDIISSKKITGYSTETNKRYVKLRK